MSIKTLPRIAQALLLALVAICATSTRAQSVAQLASVRDEAASEPDATRKKPMTTEDKISALEQLLERQTRRLDQLQQAVSDQQATIRLLISRLSPGATPADALVATVGAAEIQSDAKPQTPSLEDRVKKVEGQLSQIGSIKFSGDVRLRAESFFGLSNSLTNGSNPAVLGNELSPRHRMRIRARLQMRGTISDEFEWGMRLATGSPADNISTNQTLTDFFSRKPFALDQAFITYKPKKLAGLTLQAGKFEPPWVSTELTFDSDLMMEGFNEVYNHDFKKSALKQLVFAAWQLPFLERNSAFVRNANGTVNIEESRRGGRDLALYGGQLRARFEPSSNVVLTLSVADLFFSGTQFISPVQVFGSQLQLPLTIALPGGGTVTTQVSIPRDLLVAGNGNLGITNASTNTTNRDGRLSSGFNLIDTIARLDLKHSKRFPVSILLDFVTNTQVHDVVTAGPGGADLILPNNENNAFWGEVQVGQTRNKGDLLFGYTFMRIEKDAVLTPFNFSDVTTQSDMRGHRLTFTYTADPRVLFTVTGIVTERPTGLLGPFVATPAGSLNRPTTRLQLDTVFRF